MLNGTRVAGGGPGIGRLFAFDIGGTTSSDAWPMATMLSTPTSGPVVSSAGVYALIRSANDNVNLIRVGVANGVELARTSELLGSSFTGTGAPSPVLGTNGKTYVVDPTGSTFVVPTDFGPDAGSEWSAPQATAVAGAVNASPTLDCNRWRPASATGVLYLATESGWLVSYLVDSPRGLDTTAPWPKYARDSRNTGSFGAAPSTVLSE